METSLDFPAEDIKTLSPLILAHIGDAYFHLYVRTRLLQINALMEISWKIRRRE